ncbi:MAG: hypothetical protein ABF785_00345 [Acetobacter papayae]
MNRRRAVFICRHVHAWYAYVPITYNGFRPDLQPGQAFERRAWRFT